MYIIKNNIFFDKWQTLLAWGQPSKNFCIFYDLNLVAKCPKQTNANNDGSNCIKM